MPLIRLFQVFGEWESSPYVYGYCKTVSLFVVIGNVHRGTLRERIDRANRVDNLVFSIILHKRGNT